MRAKAAEEQYQGGGIPKADRNEKLMEYRADVQQSGQWIASERDREKKGDGESTHRWRSR